MRFFAFPTSTTVGFWYIAGSLLSYGINVELVAATELVRAVWRRTAGIIYLKLFLDNLRIDFEYGFMFKSSQPQL
jgi:hypothetical protein